MTRPAPNAPANGGFAAQGRIFSALSQTAVASLGISSCVEQLVAEGRAALPQVMIARRCGIAPRAQFAAAAAAIRLGSEDDSLLLDRLTRHNHHWSTFVGPLRDALIASGSEHMMQPLIEAWSQATAKPFVRNSEPDDALGLSPTRSVIAAVWRNWRDPAAIPAITATCLESPAAFLNLMPLFGAEAVSALAQMAESGSSEVRLMAARSLASVSHPDTRQVLGRLLYDEEQAVRDLAADGLAVTLGTAAAAPAILDALAAGYASCHGARVASASAPSGWQEIVRGYLLNLADSSSDGHRYRLDVEQLVLPASLAAAIGVERTSDPAGPALTWLDALAASPGSAEMAAKLAAQLTRGDTLGGIRIGAINKVAALAAASRMPRDEAINALRCAACAVDGGVRDAASTALSSLGDRLGEQFAFCIAEVVVRQSPVAVAKALAVGEPDAGVRAARALRKWGSVMRAALRNERIESSPALPVSRDMEPMLRLGLNCASTCLLTAPVAGLGPVSAYGAACCNLLSDRRLEISPETETTLVAALRVVRFGVEYGSEETAGQRKSVAIDFGEPIRFAAANTIAARRLPAAFDALCDIANSYAPGLPAAGIAGLVTLGDMRALPVLERIAAAGGADAKRARDAAAAIRGMNTDAAVLLRPSGGSVTPSHELVRPAGHSADSDPVQLLRPDGDQTARLQLGQEER
ncbi:MAG: HEAT repeat domain-containing protein [Armatimonadetes bacterium]|nr:HEAT repeat domain-containing protein [Armatimonadota bacterium]MDE2205402.1 HEAT repeat domain-containing protein [Armatimonadota bacterium]